MVSKSSTAPQVAVFANAVLTERALSLKAPVSFVNHSNVGMETLQLDEHHAKKAAAEFADQLTELQRAAQKTGAAEIHILDPNDLATGGFGSHAVYRALLRRDLNDQSQRAVALIPVSGTVTEAGALASSMVKDALAERADVPTFESYEQLQHWLEWIAEK